MSARATVWSFVATVVIVGRSEIGRADPPIAPLPLRSWVGDDVAVSGFDTDRGTWSGFGAGLTAHYAPFGNLEIGVEAQMMRLDAAAQDDDRHGLALRGAVTASYGVTVSRWVELDWRVGPEIGVGSLLIYGIGKRHADEELVGIRASLRGNETTRAGAHGFGVHLGIRVTRTDGSIGGGVVVGHDWGY